MVQLARLASACALAATLGCAAQPAGDPKPAPVEPDLGGGDGKADVADRVSMRGALVFGEGVGGNFTEDLQFDAWTVRVRPGARIDLEVTQRGSARTVDPTLFVFGPGRDGRYGDRARAFDDDSGWGRLPRLRGLSLPEGGELLVVVGTSDARGRGKYRLEARCPSGACEPPPPPPPPVVEGCVFGDTWRTIPQAPGIAVVARRVVTGPEGLDALTASQIVDAVRQSAYTDIADVDAAFSVIDDGGVNVVDLWDQTNGRAFTGFELGLGDNSFGAIFAHGTIERVVRINDGDLMDCRIERGSGGRDCRGDAECPAGLRCWGPAGEAGIGRCVDRAASHPDDGRECDAASPCPADSGLVCAGETRGYGLCGPAWMRETFVGAPAEVGAGVGLLEARVLARGLATVDTDVWLTAEILPADGTHLKITLVNPAGADVRLHDGPVAGDYLFLRGPVQGFSGDEQVNGDWTLLVEDPGRVGVTVETWALTIGSRWD